MPPNRLTEEDLQDLLEHVKVRVDPAFNKALQAELRARARELHTVSKASSQSDQPAGTEQLAGRADTGRNQELPRRWGLGWLNTINVLSSAVLAAAALALVFVVLVRPMLDDRAVEPELTQETTETPTATIEPTANVPTTEEAVTATPTSTDAPTPTAPPTLTPMATPTALPAPTLASTLTPSVILEPIVNVTCSWTQVTGYVQMTAPYVRLTVSRSSPMIQEIGSAVAAVQPDGSYSVTATYPAQTPGTHLIGAYGEWDGTSWLRPATTFGADCQSEGATTPLPPPATATPTPPPIPTTPAPLVAQSVEFWPDVPVLDRSTTIGFGSRINFANSIIIRARMIAFYTYQGESTPGESTCMSQSMPGRGGEKFWSTGSYTEFAPGTKSFEQSYTYGANAPSDATHLVMWLLLSDTNNQSVACWQKVLELS